MKSSAGLDQYRLLFKAAPLGRWRSAVDFGPFRVDVWEFRADGTGAIFEDSGRGGDVVRFEWRPQGDCTIWFREVAREYADPRVAAAVAEENEEPDEWRSLAYDFKVVGGYTPSIVMFEMPENEMFKFGMTMEYLQFDSFLGK
jgi:hypothetical protein